MQVEFLTNDMGITLVMSPETTLEQELLKSLANQDNVIQQARSGITVFNKTLPNALVIGKRSMLEPQTEKKND